MQGGKGHHGFGIVGIPVAATVFDAVGGGLAFGLSGAAAYLPGFGLELWIADHLAVIGHVLHQAVGRGALGGLRSGLRKLVGPCGNPLAGRRNPDR